jgi:hypothetical protein
MGHAETLVTVMDLFQGQLRRSDIRHMPYSELKDLIDAKVAQLKKRAEEQQTALRNAAAGGKERQ